MIDKKSERSVTLSDSNQQAWEEVSRSITAEQTRDFFLNNFKKLDRNHSGGVTKRELDVARENETFNSDDQRALDRIRSNYDSLVTMTTQAQNDFSISSYLSPADLIMFEHYHRRVKQELIDLANLSFLEKNFSTLDKNADGFFSKEELNSSGLLSNPKLRHVATNFNQIRSASNDEPGFERAGITRSDITNYRHNWLTGNDYFNNTDIHPTFFGQIASKASRPTRVVLLNIAD
jgi:Ca2+-binding EF-hand superfamily protein